MRDQNKFERPAALFASAALTNAEPQPLAY
jgi:hypothetical protein